MDRSFLSHSDVIKASRDFVCVRLATYEDAEESEYLTKIYGSTLANTVFVMLEPDGETKLTRAGRRPEFRSGSQLASWMKALVEEDYPNATEQRWTDTRMPDVKSLDLCLNVAACDRLPILVTVGNSADDVAAMNQQLLPIAWSEKFAGRCLFSSITTDQDLRSLTGLDKRKVGIYLVDPDAYGLTAKVMVRFGPDDQENLRQLEKALDAYQPPVKNESSHKSLAVQMGFRWHTATPVTDQQFVRATERIWGEKYVHEPPTNKDEAKERKQE